MASKEWEPLQVVSIHKDSEKASKYVLNYDELKSHMEPIKDVPVALIPVVGRAREGKSFILNYMIRFLTDTKNFDWMGDRRQPLEGFLWRPEVEPQTFGLWLSKPFILKQSNGKDIAVILMDTQGVFDEYYDQRDWSTIVGISLLLSSCIVFNVFSNLQEDILNTLQSFLQYGMEAVRADPDSNAKPFQTLMFLIRDWNTPQQFKYGLTGGQEFLEFKLKKKEKQSESANAVRNVLNQCFEEVSCFLMPKIGDKADEEGFNGCVADLSDKFVDKMNEFITHLLNPEELKPKTVDNNSITGEELIQYFKSYVEIFNSDELPKPTDLMEATAKTKDLIQINKLKESNFNDLRTFIQTKPFVTRKEFESHSRQISSEIFNLFIGNKKSNNRNIVKELNQLIENQLTSNYEQIRVENERRREIHINKIVDNCEDVFEDLINSLLDSKFLDPDVLDDNIRRFKKQILIEFKSSFGGEEEDLFAKDLNKLNKELENTENSLKSENKRRISEAKKNNSEVVMKAIDIYRKEMKSILGDNLYLTEEVFSSFETDLELRSRNYFRENCISGDSEFIKYFELDFEKKFKETKKEFRDQNHLKSEKVILNTGKLLAAVLDNYCQQMADTFDSVISNDQLLVTHEDIRDVCLNQFKDQTLYKDSHFLDKYLKKFETNVDKMFTDFKTKFNQRLQNIRDSFKTKVLELKVLYIQKMDQKFSTNDIFNDKEVYEMHNNFRDEIIREFESHSINGNGIDSDIYLNELKQLISEELNKFLEKNQINRTLRQSNLEVVVNDYFDKYEEQMEEHIETADSESKLIESHHKTKRLLLSDFKKKNIFPDKSTLRTHLQKLEDKIEKSLEESKELLELRLKNQESVAKELITDVRKYYREEIDKYYQKTSFLSKEKLIKSHESVIERTVSKFEGKRGLMSLETYKTLIEDSIKDIFKKVEDENDMNAPTLVAIGIDLGTTNSCVAYYKSDRKSGNQVIVIPNESGINVTPSMVSIRDSGTVVGKVAKDEIRAYPRQTIFSSKRLIGRQFDDQSVQNDIKLWPFSVVDDGFNNPKLEVSVNCVEKTFFAEQISAEVLKKMKDIAETHLGLKVTKAVITVPAYFNDSQKEATKDAGKLAGLEILKIINEPTAAAIAFQLNKCDDLMRNVLIYDFGGGTFDVAVLCIERGDLKVLAVGGDNHLGGEDFDKRIVEYCLKEFYDQTSHTVTKDDMEGTIAMTRLRAVCEENKCKLSSTDSTQIFIDNFYQNEELRVEITRDKFEELNDDLFVRSMDLVAQTLFDAKLTHSEIDDIVLVGGSTRIPRVQQLLSEQFDGRPLNHTVNPDEAVAKGAAIQAAILHGRQAQGLGHLKVVDVAPMSLGVKVKDGFMSVVIPRNSKVPNCYKRQYQTVSDHQTTVIIEVFEGEELMAQNNRLLGKFELNGIPSAPAGVQTIEVSFEINDEGILRVNANIVSIGKEEEMEITTHKGRLTDKELEQLVAQDSVTN